MLSRLLNLTSGGKEVYKTADTEGKALQAKEKAEVTTPAEQTRLGLVFTPEVDIFETETEITLLADMPGVKSKALNIDLRENILIWRQLEL